MKPVIALLLLSLSAAAQTTTTVTYGPVSLVLSVPCINDGEKISLTSYIHSITQYTDANGIRNGVSFYAAGFDGRGARLLLLFSGRNAS